MKVVTFKRKHKITFILNLGIIMCCVMLLKEATFGPVKKTELSDRKDEEASEDDTLSSLPGSQSDISNIYAPDEYDASGCPIVPMAFVEMVGRLGNMMCTYSNMIAMQWKLGFKYFLPKYMNYHTEKDITKPYFQSIFKNVSFPTANWANFTLARNDENINLLMFNNSRTNYKEITCNKHFHNIKHLQPIITEQMECAITNKCFRKSCLECKGSCMCTNIWVTQWGGANYLDLSLVGFILKDIIKYHLQFRDEIVASAVDAIENVARDISADETTRFVAVHVRREDFKMYSKFWMQNLLNETFFEAAMDHFRKKYIKVSFLVLSDDMEWCRTHLTSPDTHHVGTPHPEVDMAIMANCNDSIIDYGTYGMWGAIMAGGETVTSKHTFRDVQWAADYFGWTYV